eukprot:7945655-Pyramimonas_sp.AAC.1
MAQRARLFSRAAGAARYSGNEGASARPYAGSLRANVGATEPVVCAAQFPTADIPAPMLTSIFQELRTSVGRSQ